MDDYELETLDRVTDKLIDNYICKYRQEPRYLKMPMWVYCCLGEDGINYEHPKYKDLIVCPTITIYFMEEMEVF